MASPGKQEFSEIRRLVPGMAQRAATAFAIACAERVSADISKFAPEVPVESAIDLAWRFAEGRGSGNNEIVGMLEALVRYALAAICVLVLTSCVDGGECTDFCDTYLDVQVDGIAPAEAPLELRVCDGAYCDTFHLDHGECEFQEPTADPGFNACFTDGAVNVRRLFMVRNNFLPLPNDTVTLRIANSSGDELLNEMGVPAVVDAMSCVEECTAREIGF